MSLVYNCKQGHCWEVEADSSARTVTAALTQCPVCGGEATLRSGTAEGTSSNGSHAKPQAAEDEESASSRTDDTPPPPPPPGAGGGAVIDRTKPRRVIDPPDLPEYEILGILGQGGMGIVYKARQKTLQRTVALKMIISGPHAHPEELARFQSEAQAIARLQHPNIVQIHEVGKHKNCPYFSLEYVEGGNLATELGSKPQPVRVAAEMVETLARAMHVAHQRGIVHRDLKPANVLLSSPSPLRGEGGVGVFVPKITDFGLAKILDDDSGQTKTGAIMGTPSYMAPEQAAGRTHMIGPATDIWALGGILYKMLTGRPPFEADTSLDTLDLVRKHDPVPPSRLQPKVPRDLDTICFKCLEKQPIKRYASAEALADDLRRFLNGEPILARPTPMAERAVKWAKRRPVAALLIAVSVAFVLGAGLYLDQRARLAQRELKEDRRVQELQKRTDDLLVQGEGLLEEQQWEKAKTISGEVANLTAAEPALHRQKERAEALAFKADQRLGDRQRLKIFEVSNEDALLHWTLATDQEASQNVVAIARKALAQFGVGLEAGVPQVDTTTFTDGQKREVRQRCYELLVLWARATADVNETKRLQERAAKLKAEYALPGSVFDLFLASFEFYRQGDMNSALLGLQQALVQEPGHFGALYLSAICHQRLGHFDDSLVCLSECIKSRPDSLSPWLLRGHAHTELGLPGLAEIDYQTAEKLLSGRKEVEPLARFVLLVNRSSLRLKQQRYDDAVTDGRQAIDIDSKQPITYVNLAKAYRGKNELPKAIEEITKAIALKPTLASYYRERALLYQSLKDWNLALADFDKAIMLEKEPKAQADNHAYRANLLQVLKQPAEALAACDKALAINPRLWLAHYERGLILFALAETETDPEKKKSGLEESQKSLSVYLKETAKPEAKVYRVRGLVRSQLGDYLGAVDDYTQALAREPDEATHARRGWAYLLMLDAPRPALRDFKEVIKLAPDQGDGYVGRGLCLVQLGSIEKGLADTEDGLKRGPETPFLLLNAARTYGLIVGRLDSEMKGKPDLAIRERFELRALELLKKAMEKLPEQERAKFWQGSVSSDKAFWPVSNGIGFKKLALDFRK